MNPAPATRGNAQRRVLRHRQIEFNVNDGANTSNTASVDINVGGTGGTTTSVSAPALSWPGAAALVFGMLGLVLVFLIRNRTRSPG